MKTYEIVGYAVESDSGDSVTVVLKTGETVVAYPDCRAFY